MNDMRSMTRRALDRMITPRPLPADPTIDALMVRIADLEAENARLKREAKGLEELL